MTQSNPHLKLPVMPLPPEPPPEDDFPCCRQHPTEPTLTASEVKVLTETALRLGRKEASSEIVALIKDYRRALMAAYVARGHEQDAIKADAAEDCALLAGAASSLPSGATSDATSGVPGHPEVSEAVRSPHATEESK